MAKKRKRHPRRKRSVSTKEIVKMLHSHKGKHHKKGR